MDKDKLERAKMLIEEINNLEDLDEYSIGLYNGMEIMLAMIEDRKPIFREINIH